MDELYKWQTDGPFLYDMRGNAPEGFRDAGALESITSCDLAVSAQHLEFGAGDSVQQLVVTASDGFFLRARSGDFFSVEVNGDTLLIAVSENGTLDTRNGSFEIAGCNTAVQVTITQAPGPCIFVSEADTLEVDHIARSVRVGVTTNGTIALSSDADFAAPVMNAAGDTIVILVDENTSVSERTAVITIQSCDGMSDILLVQSGAPCYFVCDVDTVQVDHQAQLYTIEVSSNQSIGVSSDAAFVSPSLSEDADTVYIDVASNTSVEARSAMISLEHCDGSYHITVMQAGFPIGTDVTAAGSPEIYPNPVSGPYIFIRLPEEMISAVYAITDLSGKIQQQGRLFQQVEVLELHVDPGAYLVSISGKDKEYRGTLLVI